VIATRFDPNTDPKPDTDAVALRPGGPSDAYAPFDLLFAAMIAPETAPDEREAERSRLWEAWRSLYEHLASAADSFWLAERDGRAVGVARALVRDGLWELTEFFVRPDVQAIGVGRALLDRALPPLGATDTRAIIATLDPKAQARYLAAGFEARFPLYTVEGEARPHRVASDLMVEEIGSTPAVLEALATIDRVVLGHRRDAEHRWLLSDRRGLLWRRRGRPVAYGYLGERCGPFAALESDDIPALLAHAETAAAEAERPLSLRIPAPNRAAIAYLLSRGFRLDPFVALLMSDRPFGAFDRYLVTAPMMFL
jgi:GNAT superfamily N-acetyltransferase